MVPQVHFWFIKLVVVLVVGQTCNLKLTLNAVHRRDFLSVISEDCKSSSAFMDLFRNPVKALKTFETRFSAAIAKFNYFASTTQLLQCITSLVLLNKKSINHLQRVSAPSAAVKDQNGFPDQANNDDFLIVVAYSQASSIVKQCDKSERPAAGMIDAQSQSGSSKRTFRNRGDSNIRNIRSLYLGRQSACRATHAASLDTARPVMMLMNRSLTMSSRKILLRSLLQLLAIITTAQIKKKAAGPKEKGGWF